ncbi:MAG TPA: type II/IV secretion system ATPase subunit [Candidatus Thermoplasmatota archaeon]|nr:type II/IV secretion system ATPase subunit [Candidatus Thermoplasmatota archaeon]
MASLVPVLSYIHELRQAGLTVDFMEAMSKPESYWEKLSEEQRKSLLGRVRVPVKEDANPQLRLVKKKGKAPNSENVFVEFAYGGKWGKHFRYETFVLPRAETNGDVAISASAVAFRDMTVPTGHIISLLDSVWGGEPYDVERDGALLEVDAVLGVGEVERIWVQEPFAAISIKWDDRERIYSVLEPKLSDLERALLVTLNDRLRDVLILDESQLGYRASYLVHKVFDLLSMYRFRTERRTAYKLAYFFVRNYLGLGRVEPVMHDPAVEDISCNGPGLAAYVAHSKYQNLRTSLMFEELELNSFVVKLAQRGGKLLSVAEPLVDATLPDGSRLQAVLGREVTSRGSAFTIRKFREDPLTAVDLIRSSTYSVDEMAFLWLAVELRRSMIIMGATASGKTTSLNCLSQFVPPTHKIVTIEDTREITLQHENWLAAVTREPFAGQEGMRISMYDLLRASLRQRPDYLIVGEIRGVEGLTLFQAMSTGHTCFSTMHAGSVENAVYRLENPPIGVPRVMLTSLDFFILQGQVDIGGEPARRSVSITEINGIDANTRNLRMNELFRWDAALDKHVAANTSYAIDQARAKMGWTRTRLEEELAERRDILQGLVERKERHYRDVAKAVRTFYTERGAAEAGVADAKRPRSKGSA